MVKREQKIEGERYWFGRFFIEPIVNGVIFTYLFIFLKELNTEIEEQSGKRT